MNIYIGADDLLGCCGVWMWWPIRGTGKWYVRHDIGLLQGQFVEPNMLRAVVDDFGDLIRVAA